ncbi:hypothetical protein ACSFBM_11535 [Variovorax sp. GB1R11]|uniref:hypothetical protein n=1 Tax=Variovorax sp. GB1R11 TaxID=3443741 RepID=UPI003F48A180
MKHQLGDLVARDDFDNFMVLLPDVMDIQRAARFCFDKPGTLFYVDAPHWGNEKDYGERVFTRDDLARSAGLLNGLKGKFILSLNDTPAVRQTFSDFRIEAVKTRYSIAAKANQAVGEVLISKFTARK